MAMVDDIRKALRINSTNIDEEIKIDIEIALQEMIRAGIRKDIHLMKNHRLVYSAIRTFCLWQLSNDSSMSDKYEESWKYQLDCLRKSKEFCETEV